MSTKHVTLAEADGHLAELVEPPGKRRALGVYRGKIRLRENFNEPLLGAMPIGF